MRWFWTATMAVVAALALQTNATSAGEFRTVEEMDRYVAAQVEQDLKILREIRPRELYVAPDGKAVNPGTKEAPLDLKTAYTDASKVAPGTLVWLRGGVYEVGRLEPGTVKGTRERPVIFRAASGERATVKGEVLLGSDHVWLWGIEVVGSQGSCINVNRPCDGIKVINCVLREGGASERPKERKPTGHGIGGWDFGNDHEFYGNLVYWNGWNWLDHGFYSQNQPKHTPKRFVDNIVFENAGWGFHLYGSAPFHYGYYLEGNFAFATSLIPRGSEPGAPQGNFLIGGHKPTRCVILRANVGYQPKAAESKRCVDIGYTDGPNYNILVEDNYFMGGGNAFELKHAAQALVRRNTFWAPNGMVSVGIVPRDKAQQALAQIASDPKSMVDLTRIDFEKFAVVFEDNRYIDNGKFDLKRFQDSTGTGARDQVVQGADGRPADVVVFKRVNRYEPERVQLAIFNWPRAEKVSLDLADLLRPGEMFRIVDVHDIWGAPVAQGTYLGKAVEFKLAGPWAPEFGCYLLLRSASSR